MTKIRKIGKNTKKIKTICCSRVKNERRKKSRKNFYISNLKTF